MNFDNLLSRADDSALQYLLGADLMRLILLLDSKLATPQHLRKLIINYQTPYSLLSSKDTREVLFDLLPTNQAKLLAQVLGVDYSQNNLYFSLKNVNVRKGSEREKAVFDFFEISLPTTFIEEEKPSVSQKEGQYSLFPHQRSASRKVNDLLESNTKRVVLHMPTGSGKTRTAMSIIADHLRKNEPTLVIWLAHSEELCEQAASEFEKAWGCLGNRSVGIFRYWGNRSLNLNDVKDGILIGGLSKVYSKTKNSLNFIITLSNRTSLVVIDEAHSAIAETYKLVLDALVVMRHPNPALLGLTATPGRTWADIYIDEQLSKFFSKQKVTLEIEGYVNPVDYLVEKKYLAKAVYKPLFYEGGTNLNDSDLRKIQENFDVPDNILDRLAEDEKRNLAIVSSIENLARSHQRIIVFSTTVKHSDLLAAILQLRGHKAYSITGKTDANLRKNVINNFKEKTDDTQIICNFGVLTTGFDAPKISAALIARPTKSLVLYSQMVGRAIRGEKAGGNEMAEIITVIDHSLPGFGSVAEAFNNWEDIWA